MTLTRHITLLCYTICIVVLALVSKSSVANTLQWAFSSFPPLIYRDQSGNIEGDLVSHMSYVFNSQNIDYEIIEIPNRRARASMNNGEFDFYIAPKSVLENDELFYVSSEPVRVIKLAVFRRDKSAIVVTKEDLRTKRLVLLAAYEYGGLRSFFENNKTPITDVESHARGLLALSKERGDYFLGYMRPSLKAMREHNVKSVVHSTLSELPMYMFLRKGIPDAEMLLKQLAESSQKLNKD